MQNQSQNNWINNQGASNDSSDPINMIARCLDRLSDRPNRPRGINCKVSPPKKFNGEISEFCTFEITFKAYIELTDQATGPEACRVCLSYLTGAALSWYIDLDDVYKQDLNVLFVQMKDRFCHREQINLLHQEVATMKQNESITW